MLHVPDSLYYGFHVNVRKFWLLLFITLYATLVDCFKVSTHIYLGQELINDLKNCSQNNNFPCVNIITNDGQQVPTRIRSAVADAIIANEKTFLTGTLGPDAFADILSGQLITHPGLYSAEDGTETGFGTGDWINHLIRHAKSTEELAFAMGFAGHAAADVFAHSYVNQFAGDVYELLDHEIDVEIRHMMVETFISEHNPRLKDVNGTELGMMYQYLGGGNKIYAPIDFIRRTFIVDEVANQELARNNGGALLRGLNKITSELANSLDKKDYPFDLAATVLKYMDQSPQVKTWTDWLSETRRDLKGAGEVQQLEIIILQAVAYFWAGLQLDVNEAAMAAEITNKLSNLLGKSGNEIAKAKHQIDGLMNKAIESQNQQVLAAIKDIQEFHRHLTNAIKNYLKAVEDVARFGRKIQETKDVYETLLLEKTCTVLRKCNDIVDFVSTFAIKKTCQETKDQPKRVCKEISKGLESACKAIKVIKNCKNVKKVGEFCETKYEAVTRIWDCNELQETIQQVTRPDLVCEAANESCKATVKALQAKQTLARNAYNEALRLHQNALRTLVKQEKLVQASLKAFHDAAVYLQSIERQIREAAQSFASNQVELVRQSLLDLRGHVEGWRDQSVAATNDWISANAQAMLNSVSVDKDNVGVAAPLMDWLMCRLPTLILPIPEAAVDSICEPIRLVKKLHGEIARVENDIIKSLKDSKFPFLSDLAAAFLRFKESAPYIASSAIQKIAEDAIPANRDNPDLNLLHHAFTSKHSDARMNEQFARDNSVKHLITFPAQKLTGTIIDHMRIDMGLIGPDDHEPFQVQNFNPARNALQLMKLALLSGSELNTFSKSMNFTDSLFDNSISSILSPWLRSIDGNHQWLPIAPAYLRKEPLADELWSSSFCPKDEKPPDVRRRFQKAPLPLYSNPDAKRLIFDRIFKGPLSISLESKAGGFADLRPAGYMYQPTIDNSFPDITTIGANIACIMQGASRPAINSSIIYSSETHALGAGGTWDPNGSILFNANFEPFVGAMHQRAELKSRMYWGAASYNFDTDSRVYFDFSKARTLKLSAASRSGPQQLIIQFYGERQESVKLAVDIDGTYSTYEFEFASFKQPGNIFDFSEVKGLVFAISEENSNVTIDIDSIHVEI